MTKIINTVAMKKQIREVLSKYRGNQGYTMEHAESELLNLFSVSGSLFYQKVEKLVNEWKGKELGEIHPFSPEAEIEAGMKYFLRWLKEQNIQ